MAGPTSPAGNRGRGWKRNSVSWLVGALLALSIVAAWAINIPEKLPGVALGQPFLYRVQIGLAVFYAGLLLLTPVFRGIIEGQLPVEVSARGAKFAEDVAGSD